MPGNAPGPAAQATLRGGQIVYVDPVTDLAGFTLPASSPGAEMLAGPRWAAAHPTAPAPVAPVIPMPVPPGTTGRLVRLPNGRLGVTPQNLAAPGPAAGPPINFDPPPGTNVIEGQPNGVLVVNPLPAGFAGDDAGVLNTAILECASNRVMADGTTVQGGTVELGVGVFSWKTNVVSPYVAPIKIRGQGPQATVCQFSGTGDALSMYNAYVPGGGGSTSIVVWGGGAENLTIDLSLATVVSGAFTASNGSAVFTVAGAALANGTPVCLTGGSVPTPFAYAQPYWVVNAGAGTFQLSTTQGGAPITATANGSGTVTVVNSALHAGDIKYGSFTRLHLAYVNSAGGIGLWQDNRFYWTEDSEFEVHCLQCYNSVVVDASGATAQNTHDNNDYRISLAGFHGGNGVIFQNGANAYNSRWYIHGGIRSIASVTVQNYFLILSNVGGSTFMNNTDLTMKVESDGGLASRPALIWTQSGCQIGANGSLAFQTGNGTPSVISAQFKFSGPIWGDTVLQGLSPSAIVLGSPTTNLKTPQLLCVSPGSGTVTAIIIDGVTTGLTSGSFYIEPGHVVQVNGTAGASAIWVPMSPQ